MKKLIVTIISVSFLFSSLQPAFANENKEDVDLAPGANSAVILEQDTGKILYEKNAHKKLPPASMTKIMTMLLIMENIESGKLKYTDKIKASEYAASMGGSQIFLEPGEEMTVDEMLKGIAIASGNDASVAMAEHIAGTEEKFVQMMNEKAKVLGLKDTKFQNPTGLPESDHYSSAYDMAKMGRELLKYPAITNYTGKYEDYLRQNTDKQFWLVNTNKLVRFYDGVDGLKTGFTGEAKYCLTATAKKNGMRVVAVVMGEATPKDRNNEMGSLLDYAFNHYEVKQLYDNKKPIADVEISKGKTPTVAAVPKQPVSILLSKGEKIKNLKEEIKIDKQVNAPLKKGEKIGFIIIKNNDKILSKVELVANRNVEKASWWTLFKRTFNMFANSN